MAWSEHVIDSAHMWVFVCVCVCARNRMHTAHRHNAPAMMRTRILMRSVAQISGVLVQSSWVRMSTLSTYERPERYVAVSMLLCMFEALHGACRMLFNTKLRCIVARAYAYTLFRQWGTGHTMGERAEVSRICTAARSSKTLHVFAATLLFSHTNRPKY